MPVQRFLILMAVVVGLAGLTIGLASILSINFLWLGLVALLAPLVVRL